MAPVALQVLKMAEDDEVSLGDLCRVIGTDPGLTARVIRLANTASYFRGTETTSLERAASLLGIRTLKLVALCFSLMADLRDDSIDWAYLWRRSVAGGVLARRVAAHPLALERLNTAGGRSSMAVEELVETAFVAGLLAEVGRFALLDVDRARRLTDRHGPVPAPSLEREHLGVTADTVTGAVLQRWGLPSIIVEAIAARHPTEPWPDPPILARVLRVADAGAALILGEEDDSLDPDGRPVAVSLGSASQVFALDALTAASVSIGLTVGQLRELIDDGHQELEELLDSFDLEMPDMLDADDLITAAQHQFARLSLDSALSQSRRGESDPLEVASPDRLLSTDSLTGLPNRRAVDTFLANHLALRGQSATELDLGLLLVELDRYREIHSSLGPIAGDELIHAFGRRLADASEASSLFARFGVQRFALVATEGASTRLAQIAEELRLLTGAEPFASSSADIDLTISCGGVLLAAADLGSPTDLVMAAEMELERSVAAGGNQTSLRQLT